MLMLFSVWFFRLADFARLGLICEGGFDQRLLLLQVNLVDAGCRSSCTRTSRVIELLLIASGSCRRCLIWYHAP